MRRKALMLPYGEPFPEPFPADVAFVGCNMTSPPWADRVPKGVRVVTTADVSREKMCTVTATVEHAWGLILAAHRRLVAAALQPSSSRNCWIAPYQLRGRTIGIVGLGRIGRGVARIATAFDMRVIWHDAYPQSCLSHWEYCPLDTLLEQSDIVLVAASARDALTPNFVSKLRMHGVLVSISPIGIIGGPHAILSALRRGTLRAAALDDWPSDVDVPVQLVETGRLIVTPHIGGSTEDARQITARLVEERMEELRRQAEPDPCLYYI